MRTKEQCLEDIGKYTVGDYQYKAAQAELEILVAQEYLVLLQKTRETVHKVLADMNGQIQRFREVVDRAATASEDTSERLVRWTKVLGIATGALVLTTAVLVIATLKATH